MHVTYNNTSNTMRKKPHQGTLRIRGYNDITSDSVSRHSGQGTLFQKVGKPAR
jgi:hypothetical protein